MATGMEFFKVIVMSISSSAYMRQMAIKTGRVMEGWLRKKMTPQQIAEAQKLAMGWVEKSKK